MKFISEDIINPVIDRVTDEAEIYKASIDRYAKSQPFLLAFLLSEGFDVLTDEEKSLMMYLAIIIHESVHSVYTEMEKAKMDLIEFIDDQNWERIENHNLKGFKAIADHFFTDYPQEDLLAFVEDSVIEDEEYSISDIGRTVIFVSMKTLIDVLHETLSTNSM